MNLRYGFDRPTLSETVSPIHGFFFYILYLVAVFDLGRRADWSLKRMVLIMLAGTVPFLSFYAERVVTRTWVRQTDSYPIWGQPAGQPVTHPAPVTRVGRRRSGVVSGPPEMGPAR